MVLYTSNTPQANQTIALTQPLILANFGYLPQWIAVDHIFNSDSTATNNGYHKQVSFNANQAAPGLDGAAAVLYSNFTNGTSGDTALWLQNAAGQFPITGVLPSAMANGYTCLPGGLILQWGVNTTPMVSSVGAAHGLIAITLPLSFPTATLAAVAFPRVNTSTSTLISLSVDYTPTSPGPGTFSRSGFTVNWCTDGRQIAYNSGFFWMAIGN